MKISIFQMGSEKGNPEANIYQVRSIIKKVKDIGSDLLILPEFWLSGYDLAHIRDYALNLESDLIREIARLAKSFKTGIAGTYPIVRDNSIYNTAILFGPNGGIIGSYDKRHLFSLMKEDEVITPGSECPVFDTPWGKIGFGICFDLRFPELFRKLMLKSAEIVIVPAYWPSPRLQAWRLLLRARAVENQFFLIGCNRSREADQDFGYSAAIHPSGQVIAEAGVEEILLNITLDISHVKKIRQKLPFLSCRFDEEYGL